MTSILTGGFEIFVLTFGLLLPSIIPVIIIRYFFSGKLWIGMVLSVIFGPFGHFYVKGGFIYIVILCIIGFIIMKYFQENMVMNELLWVSASAALMFARFKIKAIHDVEIKS